MWHGAQVRGGSGEWRWSRISPCTRGWARGSGDVVGGEQRVANLLRGPGGGAAACGSGAEHTGRGRRRRGRGERAVGRGLAALVVARPAGAGDGGPRGGWFDIPAPREREVS
jgi:hypothetical protein